MGVWRDALFACGWAGAPLPRGRTREANGAGTGAQLSFAGRVFVFVWCACLDAGHAEANGARAAFLLWVRHPSGGRARAIQRGAGRRQDPGSPFFIAAGARTSAFLLFCGDGCSPNLHVPHTPNNKPSNPHAKAENRIESTLTYDNLPVL